MVENLKTDYQAFIEQVLEFEIVWGLQSDEGWAVCESNDYIEKEVLLFWSSKALAKIHVTDEWKKYQPIAIELNEFIDSWLHGMDEDGIYAGVNWTKELDGIEIEPVILIDDLLDN